MGRLGAGCGISEISQTLTEPAAREQPDASRRHPQLNRATRQRPRQRADPLGGICVARSASFTQEMTHRRRCPARRPARQSPHHPPPVHFVLRDVLLSCLVTDEAPR
jgi:hypothetical protein